MGQLVPLVKPDACAKGVAALSAGLTGLVLHVQKLPSFARKGWNTKQGQGWGNEAAAALGEVGRFWAFYREEQRVEV